MNPTSIPYQQTGYFSSFICDYLNQTSAVKPFYNRYPSLENFKDQIEEKRLSFRSETRNLITQVLQNQYTELNASLLTQKNIELLQEENTFTITTGHQLNLFTGPLYFLYKIISTINLCEELSKIYPEQNFVPIYWMATEDHDFEEINYFNFKGKKVKWDKAFGGAVGELTTEGLDRVFKTFSNQLGPGKNAAKLKSLFSEAYLKHNNLAEATLYLANELFGEYGLVIVDANNKQLKQEFAPFVEIELLEQRTYEQVSKTNDKLSKLQVNPREINLFYLQDGIRERIIQEKDLYTVNNTNVSFTKKEILKHLHEVPERFSPNVLLRPLYQEVILPNLCYIGGGGELAYWLQLKSTFQAFQVPFPMLLLRNSALVIKEQQSNTLNRLELSVEELFCKQEELLAKKTKDSSNLKIDFSSQKEFLQEQFKELYSIAEQTDKSFIGAVAAQEKKQLNGLANLEKRLLRAEKRNHSDYLSRVVEIQNELFPKQSLQERQLNFSELYLEYGEDLISILKEELKPLDFRFKVLS
ncbi:bacillithiol biosynthesis cysteine-adding enzyme BshC [Pseudofulvibacter geojedonensis]|uniref:Putative cysteine ligase BshC n=1 Tax=Pseudofulvibacter geojedonensis TaxID=1123758 RepID=A0ABW3I0L1_9FLAO